MAKNKDDLKMHITKAATLMPEQPKAILLHPLHLAQSESMNKGFGGTSAIEGARACLAKADSGNPVIGELAMSLRRLTLETETGAYKNQAEQLNAELRQRAGELGQVTTVQITGDVSVFAAMNKVIKEQLKVLRALVDAIDTQILAHQAQAKRRSPKP